MQSMAVVAEISILERDKIEKIHLSDACEEWRISFFVYQTPFSEWVGAQDDFDAIIWIAQTTEKKRFMYL